MTLMRGDPAATGPRFRRRDNMLPIARENSGEAVPQGQRQPPKPGATGPATAGQATQPTGNHGLLPLRAPWDSSSLSD